MKNLDFSFELFTVLYNPYFMSLGFCVTDSFSIFGWETKRGTRYHNLELFGVKWGMYI